MRDLKQSFSKKFGNCPENDIDNKLRWETMFHGYATAHKEANAELHAELKALLENVERYSSFACQTRIIAILKEFQTDANCVDTLNKILNHFKIQEMQLKKARVKKVKVMSGKEAMLRPIAYYIVNFFKRNPTGTQVDLADQMSISHRSLKNYIVKLRKQNVISLEYRNKYQTTYRVNPESEWSIQ